jgi:hypothetical protein
MLLVLFAGAVAIFATGCWMMAAQLAPVAISAAEDVGAGAIHLVAGVGNTVTGEKHKDDDLASAETNLRADIKENGDSCQQLAAEAPGVIELRKSAAGAPEYRELGLGLGDTGESLDDAQWTPITVKGDADGGWRPALNFLQMNFSPPLNGATVPETTSNFLAYAPSQFISPDDGDRMAAMTSNFGKPVGTFTWQGHYYHYVVTSTLPCFPPPPERIAADTPAAASY